MGGRGIVHVVEQQQFERLAVFGEDVEVNPIRIDRRAEGKTLTGQDRRIHRVVTPIYPT